MNLFLVLVHGDEDVAALERCARYLKSENAVGVWLVHSPAIAVPQDAAAKTFDADIASLVQSELAAVARRDYVAAGDYAAQAEGKKLERVTALRDAWKGVASEARTASLVKIFNPFVELLNPNSGIAIKITSAQDHYDRENWVPMLNSLTPAWHKPMRPGTFCVLWPTACPEVSQKLASRTPAAKVPVSIQVPAETQIHTAESLRKKHYFGVAKIAKSAGVFVEGNSTDAMITAILEKQKLAAAA